MMNQGEPMADDEISLFELFEQLRNGWRTVAGGLLVGVLGAGAAIALLPAQYQASTLIEVGQIGQVSAAGPGAPVSVGLEAPAVTVERMKSPPFVLEVAQQSGIEVADATDAARHLSATLQRNAPLIEVRTTGASRDEAIRLAESAIKLLHDKHMQLFEPRVKQLRSELDVTREKLGIVESELAVVDKTMAEAGRQGARAAALPYELLTSLRVQKATEAISLRQAIVGYNAALLPPATRPTDTVEGVYASRRPVSPRKALLLALGAVGGLLAGTLLVFLANGWRNAQRERNAQPRT